MRTDLDYLAHLESDNARFADAAAAASPQARVPSCPDWDTGDLVWHLAGVQHFWSRIVGERCLDPEQLKEPDRERPADREALLALGRRSSADLFDLLTRTPPETPAWTWAEEQTVGFIRRRQAHEALIHRVDAELTADRRTAMDPELSADGVDEVLRIMYDGAPPGLEVAVDASSTLRLSTTDTKDSWLVTLGWVRGVDQQGRDLDEPGLVVAPAEGEGDAAAEVSGSAADLDCWLWRRPTLGALARSGDADVLAAFEATIAPGIP